VGSWAALAPFIIKAIGDIGAAANAPNPFQPHFPFTGSANANAMAQTGADRMNALFGPLAAKAAAPVTLPHAVVHDLPTFSGGGLPMDIGMAIQPSDIGMDQPPSIPGLDLSALEHIVPHLPSTAPPSPPNAGLPSPFDTAPPDASGHIPPGYPGGPGKTIHGPNDPQPNPRRQSFTDSLLAPPGSSQGASGDTSGTADFAGSQDPTTAAISLLKMVAGG
jgi:hypothetical protein